jgi:hypothetical protein
MLLLVKPQGGAALERVRARHSGVSESETRP